MEAFPNSGIALSKPVSCFKRCKLSSGKCELKVFALICSNQIHTIVLRNVFCQEASQPGCEFMALLNLSYLEKIILIETGVCVSTAPYIWKKKTTIDQWQNSKIIAQADATHFIKHSSPFVWWRKKEAMLKGTVVCHILLLFLIYKVKPIEIYIEQQLIPRPLLVN